VPLINGISVAKVTVVREGKENGVYRSTWNGDVCPDNKVLEQYREEGRGSEFWNMRGEFIRAFSGNESRPLDIKRKSNKIIIDR
jgi:hypothetical protein